MNSAWMDTPAGRRGLGLGIAGAMLAVLVTLLQLATQAQSDPDALSPEEKLEIEVRQRAADDVREAAYHHVFDKVAAVAGAGVDVLCLDYHNGPLVVAPPKGYMKRFAAHRPEVRAAPACARLDGKTVAYVNTEFVFWLSNFAATLTGDYRVGNGPRMDFTLWLRNDGMGWEVSGMRVTKAPVRRAS